MTAWQRKTVATSAMALSLAWSVPAAAELTCEQMLVITQSVVRYRDQGYSLDQVLGALKGVDLPGKLTTAEMDILRQSISFVFMSQASPEEVALECIRARDAAKR